jgi:DNA mismatch repair protein MutS2
MPLVEQVLTSIGDDQDELNGLSSYASSTASAVVR